MYPHERSLVKRLEGKPFVLVGVNSDRDREELRKVRTKEQIAWRSWWDGGSTVGPIATRWNVLGWPAVFVIDHRGVIRGRELRGTALDRLVDELVKDALEGEP